MATASQDAQHPDQGSYGASPSPRAPPRVHQLKPSLALTDHETHAKQLQRVNELLAARVQALPDLPVTSTKDAIQHALEVLPDDLPQDGLGLEGASQYLGQ